MSTVSIQAETFNLPDLGEGLTEAELVTWKVAVGESVALDQVIAEVETAKSLVEVPTPYAGTVLVLHGAEGETLAVGRPLITVGPEGSDPAAFAAQSSGAVGTQEEGAQSYREEERAGSGSGNVLIGYGTSEEGSPTRRRRGRRAAPLAAQAPSTERAPDAAVSVAAVSDAAVPARAAASPSVAARVVNPLVRRLARDLGVDVAALVGTGADGLVMRADVHAAASAAPAGSGQPGTAAVGTQGAPASSGRAEGTAASGAGTGDVDPRSGLGIAARTPITGVRKVVAQTMSRSRREIPEATVWVDVDATELLKLRRGIRPDANGRRPGVLALVGRFVAAGLQRVPELNSRIEQAADGSEEVVTLDGVNLGIAAQTERGLVVPAVERAERLSARELDAAIAELINTARQGKATPAQLTRGTFTLNNYGVFDVDGSAAIINHPQVAILGLGRIKARPWVVDGEIVVREITELTLSFDHRVCDGGAASRFLRFVADAIERPGEALAEL